MTDDTGYPGSDWSKPKAAAWYAEQGWPVIPLHDVTVQHTLPGAANTWLCSCRPGGRADCPDKGKHPRTMNGVKDASTDAEVVAGWWEIWPEANIGIATGYPFAFVVDEDVPGALADRWPDEVSTLTYAADMGGIVPAVQQTPRGRHYLFSTGWPADELPELGNSAGGRGRSLGQGIDTRGRGGYIVAAPSVTPDGTYRWRSSPIGPCPVLPDAMDAALRPEPLRATVAPANYVDVLGEPDDKRVERYVLSAVASAADELRSAQVGERNHTLNEVAFRLGTIGGRHALGRAVAHDALYGAWVGLFPEGVWADGRASFEKTFQSGWLSGLKRPREPWPPVLAGVASSDGLGFAGPALPPEAPVVVGPVALAWGEFLAKDMTKADWLAGDLFEAGQQVALVGAGKAGKSLLAFELARAIVRGVPYLAAPARHPRRVAYIDHENSQRDIQQRALAFGFTAEDLEGLAYFSFPVLPPLDTRAGGVALSALVETSGGEVLFLDTVSRMIEGNENDSDTWLNLYRYSLMPLKARGIATVRLDHFGKDHDRGARGSSAKTQDVDHVWTLTRGEGGSLTLRRTHSRTGLGREELQLIRHGEQTEDGWVAGQTRHVVSDIAFKPAEWLWRIEVSKRLDDAGVPSGAGVPTVRTALARLDVRAGKARVEDLVRWRKAGGNDSGE